MSQFIKIGSGCVIDERGAINYRSLRNKIAQIEDYWNRTNVASVIVVSGAIALGKMLGNEYRSNEELKPVELQSFATVGQMHLMRLYADMAKRIVGQILVTESDLNHPNDIEEVIRYNADKGILTLINYNDGIVADEVRKDNDTIAARLAVRTNALRLIILGQSYDGFMNTENEVIERIGKIDEKLYRLCSGKSHHGNGGFETKLDAAKIIVEAGKEMIIGNIKYDLDGIINGTVPRTLFKKME